MPRDPQGRKRPADVIGNAVHVVRLATGQIEQPTAKSAKNEAAVSLGRLGGLKGGKARASKMTPEQRSDSARKAVTTRWKNAKKPVK
jgi:hypothetical protein